MKRVIKLLDPIISVIFGGIFVLMLIFKVSESMYLAISIAYCIYVGISLAIRIKHKKESRLPQTDYDGSLE